MRVDALVVVGVLWTSFALGQEVGLEPSSPATEASGAQHGRFGVSAHLGALAPRSSVAVGAELHAGVGLSEHWGVVVQLSALGAWDGTIESACDFCGLTGPTSNPGSSVISAAGLVEYTFLEKSGFFAGGPVAAYGTWTGAIGPSSAVAVGGAMGGVDLKVGATIGRFDRQRATRPGFSIGVDVLLLFGSGHFYTPGLQGRDGVFTRTGLAWGLAPALFIGFDWR